MLIDLISSNLVVLLAVLQDGEVGMSSFEQKNLEIGPGMAATFGIIVLFLGKRVNDKVPFLREFSIPEPVTGGLLMSIIFGIVYAASGTAVNFDLAARDFLLVYFFTTIGINAQLKDLLAGGKPLVVLLVITIGVQIPKRGNTIT